MTLLRKLRSKPFCNELHFIIIAVILFYISLRNPYFFILLGIYLIFLFLKTDYFYYSILVIILLGGLMSLRFGLDKLLASDSYIGTIIEVKNERSYVIRSGIQRIIVYDKNQYEVGNVVSIKGKINEISPKGYPSDFDYELYLRSKGISYSFYANSSSYIKEGFTIARLKASYIKYLKKYLRPTSLSYVESMVFGDNLLDEEIKDGYSVLGISHILAISGMHIMLLYGIIRFLLLNIFHYYREAIPISIISLYVILIGAPASSVRALLFLIIRKLNSNSSIRYSKLDILSIAMLIMLLFNPYQAYYIGFILSYLVSFILIYTNELVKVKNKLIGMLISYSLIYLITLPFVLNMSNIISIFSLILSPILTLLVSHILLPISYILALIPFWDFVFGYIYLFTNVYVVNLASMLPVIHMPYMNPLMILGYYLIFTLIIISLYKERGRLLSYFLMILYLLAIKLLVVYIPISTVTFLDCGQGDCTVIKNGSSVVVVDAFNSFDYLKDLGIARIDYLVLTHSDDDHLGDYEEVLDYFEVKLVLYPVYDYKLERLVKPYKSLAIKAGYNMKIKNLSFSFISPLKNYNNSNMNSLAIRLNIYNTSFLLCADITSEVEHDLVLKYHNYLRVDILKAGHHGSITSSSPEFLEVVKPSYSIISAGLNNKYHHPDPSVLARLKRVSRVYNTINDGSIRVTITKNRYMISSYR